MESTSRLCDLIADNLLIYLEPIPVRLSKDNGKDILLSLTRVRREIQQWTTNLSSKADEVMGGGSYNNHCCRQSIKEMVVGEHDCLCNVISAMVAFLNADCQFVRHVAVNIILSISHFLIKFECLWVKSLQWIWFSLQVLMPTFFPCPELSSEAVNVNGSLMLEELKIGDNAQNHVLRFARFIALLKSRLLNINLFVVVHLFQTLRSMLKSLKHESDDLEKVFLQYAVSSMMKMPWGSISEFFGNYCYTGLRSFIIVDQLDCTSSLTRMKNLLLGTILQLCCSLVEAYDLEADDTRCCNKLPVFLKFTDLLPKLLSCCFIDHLGNLGNSREFLYGYLRHKLLIMMTRLSLYSSWIISHPEPWLKLLCQNFGEILHQPISGCDDGSENFLGESPFLANISKRDKSYARHLQRQAVFLLFKCSFTIASVEAGKECGCKEETTSSSHGLQICWKHCHSGSFEALAWLQRWRPLDMFQDCQNYSESCNSFALSFLQLYMEEDDLLFKMLLQLLDTPFSAWLIDGSHKNKFVGANEDLLCHFSTVLCPNRLFHLVLLLLHYDHLVLVDYLISKDTGIYCLQYLLRCLCAIRKSWPSFMQFTIIGNKHVSYHKKRRKISQNEDEGPMFLSSITATLERKLMRRHKNGQAAYEIRDSHTFENAKGCLCSLKRTLGELQRKRLFPYNLNPLLKRKKRSKLPIISVRCQLQFYVEKGFGTLNVMEMS